MTRNFVSDWLEYAIESQTPLVDALYSLRPADLTRAVQKMRYFEGTKVMLSCTDRTPLAKVLKQALFLADLVIIVPAPLWVSCGPAESRPYVEFNVESVALASSSHFSPGLVRNLSRLIAEDPEVFADGAVTFLPVLGESQHRWSHPELALPELPRPYSDDKGSYSPFNAHVEALYGLCGERLTAERLGAMHLNAASFTAPVFGDVAIGKQGAGDWVRHLWEVNVPDLTSLSMTQVARIRRDLPGAVSQFSRATMRVLGSADGEGSAQAMAEDLYYCATILKKQMESALTGVRLPETAVMLGSGGQEGGILPTVDFLVGGGTLTDLIRLITVCGNEKLQLSRDSIWAAARSGDL